VCIVAAAVVALYTTGVDKAIRATYRAQGAQQVAESEQRFIEQVMIAFVGAIQHGFNTGQIIRLKPIPDLPDRWMWLFAHANNQLIRFEALVRDMVRGRSAFQAIRALMERLNRFRPQLGVDQLTQPSTGSPEVDSLAIVINKTFISPPPPRHSPLPGAAPFSSPQPASPWGAPDPTASFGAPPRAPFPPSQDDTQRGW
jgi:hypothetical protein